MKKYLLGILFIWSMFGCTEDKIDTYNDKDYILFTKYIQDSTAFSFLSYPNVDQAEFMLEVKLVGMPSDRDREYKVSVMDEFTNAPSGSYILPDRFVMKAGQVVDTCVIILKKDPAFSESVRRLTLQLEATADFALGQSDRLAAIINISNIISKPDWWNSTIVKTWLGEYSDMKYELFIKVNDGKVDLDVNDTNDVRTCTLKLKNYLKQMAESNQTVYEADGSEMTVAYIGG